MAAQSDLTSWTKERLGALYTSKDDEFAQAFESTFSPDVDVTVNGEQVPREKAKETIHNLRGAMINANVEFDDLTAEPKSGGAPGEAGTVSGSWTVTRSLRFRVRAAPAQAKRHIKFMAKIEPNSSASADDKRRIVHLVETVEELPMKVNLHSVPVVPKASE